MEATDVTGSGLPGMDSSARRKEEAYLPSFAGDSPGELLKREDGGDDGNL